MDDEIVHHENQLKPAKRWEKNWREKIVGKIENSYANVDALTTKIKDPIQNVANSQKECETIEKNVMKSKRVLRGCFLLRISPDLVLQVETEHAPLHHIPFASTSMQLYLYWCLLIENVYF